MLVKLSNNNGIVMKKLLSIIVPVYNVEKYVGGCIESIINQTYTQFELIIINDGSTDCSFEICKKYAMKDKRIVLVSQENLGVAAARNKGLNMANGEWIGFVDSDDYLDSDFYETLMSKICHKGADIICCGVRSITESGEVVKHLASHDIPTKEKVLLGDELLFSYIHPQKRYLFWSPWDKIIRADIAKKHRFDVGKTLGEDFYYCLKCIIDANYLYYIPSEKYNYLLRSTSAVHIKKFDNHSFDSYILSGKATILLKENNVSSRIIRLSEIRKNIIGARIIRKYYNMKKNIKLIEKYNNEIVNIRINCFKCILRYGLFMDFKNICLLCMEALIPKIIAVKDNI